MSDEPTVVVMNDDDVGEIIKMEDLWVGVGVYTEEEVVKMLTGCTVTLTYNDKPVVDPETHAAVVRERDALRIEVERLRSMSPLDNTYKNMKWESFL